MSSPLFKAIKNRASEEQIKLLLSQKDAYVNEQTYYGITVLMLVAEYFRGKHRENVVRMLLDHGADVSLKNIYDLDALMFAAKHSRSDIKEKTIQILLDAGADVNSRGNDDGGDTVLMNMIEYSEIDSTEHTVRILLGAGADVNAIDDFGWTPLTYLIITRDHFEGNIKNYLLEAGAVVDIKTLRSYSKDMWRSYEVKWSITITMLVESM